MMVSGVFSLAEVSGIDFAKVCRSHVGDKPQNDEGIGA